MKKLLYRLPRSRSFARLLSILAFAVLGLYYPSKSFATVYCKDNSPLTPCTRFSGTTCPPPTKPLYTTKCSTTGGTTGSGSEWQAIIKIGDLGIGIDSVEVGIRFRRRILSSLRKAFAVPALSIFRKIQ